MTGPPTRATHTKARRKAGAAKAAATRAAKKAKRSAAARKAAATRRKNKEHGKVARKKARKARKPAKRRVHKGKRSHASYVAAGKKAARSRKRHKAAKAAGRKTTKRRRPRKLSHKKGATTRRRRRTRRLITFKTRKSPRSRRRVKKAVYRTTTRRRKYRYSVRAVKKNPVAAMQHALTTAGIAYIGFVGVRALNYQLGVQLAKVSSLSSYAGLIAPAASFVLATAVLPKVMKGNAKMVEAIQLGAVFALGEALLKKYLPTSAKTAVGLSDFGFGGYSEYIPLREYTPEPLQLGTDVQEAMALDEYVEGMGAEVEEALASPGLSADELQGFQTGYAGGSLAKTVFTE